jgi:hypothetical protein
MENLKPKEKSLDYKRSICSKDGDKFLFCRFYNALNETIAYWDNQIFNKVTVVSYGREGQIKYEFVGQSWATNGSGSLFFK